MNHGRPNIGGGGRHINSVLPKVLRTCNIRPPMNVLYSSTQLSLYFVFQNGDSHDQGEHDYSQCFIRFWCK